MKSAILIAIVSFGLSISAQTALTLQPAAEMEGIGGIYDSERLFDPGLPLDQSVELYHLSQHVGIHYNSFNQPSAPLLTTKAADLEICTGNSTRLTASSNHLIYWYTTPPPLGSPVGTGTSYVTPVLNTGYYTFYAIADDNGIKSEISSMEVVMVYPSPSLNVTSSAPVLCAGETATLTVSGTTSYEWENGPLSSEFVIRPNEKQVYRVTGINTAGCRATVFYTQVVESCALQAGEDVSLSSSKTMGMEALDEELQMSIFPNPNNGEFNLTMNVVSENTTLEIYNSLGSLIYNHPVKEEKSSLDIRNYPDGIYVVRIVENNKLLKQQKVVKD